MKKKSITNWRRRLLTLGMTCVLLLPVLLGTPAHAQSSTPEWMASMGNWFGNLMLSIASWFTWLGGSLLDYAVKELVLGMGELIVEDTNLGATINDLWTIIRDVCNLIFVFGFVYLGIRMILRNDSSDDKRFLAALIIGAILINFSLFFTKIIIDVSNFLAVEVYEAFIPSDPNTGDPSGIAELFANQMGIVDIIGSAPDASTFANLTMAGNVAYFFAGAIFLLVAAFTFAAGALLLIVRFVTLVFIMVFAPILFAASVFPQTAKYASDLWRKLFSSAVFAPIYLFLLLITFKIVESTGQSITGSGFQNALSNQVDAFGVIVRFTIIILFMIMALKAAHELGIVGSDRIMERVKKVRVAAGKKIEGAAIGTATYLPRAAARAAVGSASRYGLKQFDTLQAEGRATHRMLARLNLDRDIRNTLESGKNYKAGLKYSSEDLKKQKQERTIRLNQNKAVLDREKQFSEQLDLVNDAGTSAEEFAKATKELGAVIRNMTNDEKSRLKLNQLTDKRLATNLSDQDIESIGKSGKFSEQQVSEIKNARKIGFKNIAEHGDAGDSDGSIAVERLARETAGKSDAEKITITDAHKRVKQDQRRALVSRSVAEIGKMDHEIFANKKMAPLITPQMVQARMNNGATDEQLKNISGSISDYLAANPQSRKKWRQWSENGSGAWLNLNIPDGNGTPPTPPPPAPPRENPPPPPPAPTNP